MGQMKSHISPIRPLTPIADTQRSLVNIRGYLADSNARASMVALNRP